MTVCVCFWTRSDLFYEIFAITSRNCPKHVYFVVLSESVTDDLRMEIVNEGHCNKRIILLNTREREDGNRILIRFGFIKVCGDVKFRFTSKVNGNTV